jgi:hypothetical protein
MHTYLTFSSLAQGVPDALYTDQNRIEPVTEREFCVNNFSSDSVCLRNLLESTHPLRLSLEHGEMDARARLALRFQIGTRLSH